MNDLINSLEWKIGELIGKYNEQKEIVSSLGQEIENLRNENNNLISENNDLRSRAEGVDHFKNDVEAKLLNLVEKLDNLENS